MEMQEYGVRAVSVQPGFVNTPMNDDFMKQEFDLSNTRFQNLFKNMA